MNDGDNNHSSTQRENRAYKRYSYVGKASVRLPGGFSDEHGVILDLSMGGCLLRLDKPLDVLLETEIEINLQSSYLACRAFGTIRRFLEAKHVIGCSFEKLTKFGQMDIARLIDDLESGALEAAPQPIVFATGEESLP